MVTTVPCLFQVLDKEILEAGQEERRLALERGDFHEGVPAITVVVDGGWSKRTHKHTYNGQGGVAIVVGEVTKKILHVGNNLHIKCFLLYLKY